LTITAHGYRAGLRDHPFGFERVACGHQSDNIDIRQHEIQLLVFGLELIEGVADARLGGEVSSRGDVFKRRLAGLRRIVVVDNRRLALRF